MGAQLQNQVANGIPVGAHQIAQPIPVQNGGQVNQAPFPVGQLSQQQAVMHAQAMQQAQFAMHQQMHQVQYLHTAPVVHPGTSHANYHHQAQNININIHASSAVENNGLVENTVASS